MKCWLVILNYDSWSGTSFRRKTEETATIQSKRRLIISDDRLCICSSKKLYKVSNRDFGSSNRFKLLEWFKSSESNNQKARGSKKGEKKHPGLNLRRSIWEIWLQINESLQAMPSNVLKRRFWDRRKSHLHSNLSFCAIEAFLGFVNQSSSSVEQ